MSTPSPKHLITELGVLKSFSLGKRMAADKMRDYKNKVKKMAKTKKEEDDLLRQIIVKDAQKYFNSVSVPGIISNKVSEKKLKAEKKLIDLTYFASIVSKKMIEKNMSKFEKCYLINILVNMLNLGEDDFDNFHKIFLKFKEGEIESPEDGDDLTD